MVMEAFLVRVPAVLLALTVHELAHGMAAKMMGDRTAEYQGRLTLNPLSHLDLLGTLMLFFGPFGWAKPVPVNPMNFKNPLRGMALVAAAGPLSNITLAAIAGLFFRLDLVLPNTLSALFLSIFFMINIGLAVFNLLPIFPLDGSRILMAFLSKNQLQSYMRAMKVVPQAFLLMIVLEWVLNKPILSLILMPVFNPIFKAATLLFIGL
jgi:Zn-dependent protease